jgi:DNA-binding Lrp family transcriptional regulator
VAPAAKNSQAIEIDDIDRQLLRLLEQDARMTNADLASSVGIAQSTCIQRVRNLVKNGVIEGFHAKINPSATGHGLQVLINVTLRATARQQLSAFMDEMKALPEVQQVFFLGGSEDFILHLATNDSDHVREFVLANLSANPAVANTRTNIIFEHAH